MFGAEEMQSVFGKRRRFREIRRLSGTVGIAVGGNDGGSELDAAAFGFKGVIGRILSEVAPRNKRAVFVAPRVENGTLLPKGFKGRKDGALD